MSKQILHIFHSNFDKNNQYLQKSLLRFPRNLPFFCVKLVIRTLINSIILIAIVVEKEFFQREYFRGKVK